MVVMPPRGGAGLFELGLELKAALSLFRGGFEVLSDFLAGFVFPATFRLSGAETDLSCFDW